MRVDIADWDENIAYAEYDNFRVGSGADKYELASLGSYTGTAGKCQAHGWRKKRPEHSHVLCSNVVEKSSRKAPV